MLTSVCAERLDLFFLPFHFLCSPLSLINWKQLSTSLIGLNIKVQPISEASMMFSIYGLISRKNNFPTRTLRPSDFTLIYLLSLNVMSVNFSGRLRPHINGCTRPSSVCSPRFTSVPPISLKVVQCGLIS